MFEGLVTCTYCTLYCVCMITSRLGSSITRDTESNLHWGWLGLGTRLDNKWTQSRNMQQLKRAELLVIHYARNFPVSCLLSSADNSCGMWYLVCWYVITRLTIQYVRLTVQYVRLTIWYMKLTQLFGTYSASHFGGGLGTIWLDEVGCDGTETVLSDCDHSGWATHDCSHVEDAGVRCSGEECERVMVRVLGCESIWGKCTA